MQVSAPRRPKVAMNDLRLPVVCLIKTDVYVMNVAVSEHCSSPHISWVRSVLITIYTLLDDAAAAAAAALHNIIAFIAGGFRSILNVLIYVCTANAIIRTMMMMTMHATNGVAIRGDPGARAPY